jgi:arylamine N-acetyltransferase
MVEHQEIGTYSDEQIDNYLSFISLPTSKYGKFSAKTASSEEALEYLTTLQKHQLSTVPFENLDLHYSIHRTISIDKDDMYEKIVTANRGRGGYCMQVNLFFATVLKSLGFELISTGGRVHIDGGPGEWYVLVIPIDLDNLDYVKYPPNTEWYSDLILGVTR